MTTCFMLVPLCHELRAKMTGVSKTLQEAIACREYLSVDATVSQSGMSYGCRDQLTNCTECLAAQTCLISFSMNDNEQRHEAVLWKQSRW